MHFTTLTRCINISVIGALGLSCGSRVAPEGRTGTPIQSTRPAPAATRAAATLPASPWFGVYASPAEIGGFSGTVLALERGIGGDIGYRMRSYTDVRLANEIQQDELSGSCLASGGSLYLPQASGYLDHGKPQLLASIERYTRVEINGHQVLMRDDALRAFRDKNTLYDYGILIKTSGGEDDLLDLRTVEHPSIKVLYADPSRGWQDPFVHGPNHR